jgi:hypothetical protein
LFRTKVVASAALPTGERAITFVDGRSAMTSVDLFITEPGRLTTPVGRVDFYALPIQKEGDFSCTPPSIVSFTDAQAISIDVTRQAVKGRIGRYEWRKTS